MCDSGKSERRAVLGPPHPGPHPGPLPPEGGEGGSAGAHRRAGAFAAATPPTPSPLTPAGGEGGSVGTLAASLPASSPRARAGEKEPTLPTPSPLPQGEGQGEGSTERQAVLPPPHPSHHHPEGGEGGSAGAHRWARASAAATSPTPSPLPEGEGQGEGDRLSDKDFRRALRREQTPAERKLWSLLRNRRLAGHKVRRQQTVGPYTVDFYCHDAGLTVEVDGSIHGDPARADADHRRQLALAKKGLRVVRVTNEEVIHQPEAALARILDALASPHPVPLPPREGTSLGRAVRAGRGVRGSALSASDRPDS